MRLHGGRFTRRRFCLRRLATLSGGAGGRSRAARAGGAGGRRGTQGRHFFGSGRAGPMRHGSAAAARDRPGQGDGLNPAPRLNNAPAAVPPCPTAGPADPSLLHSESPSAPGTTGRQADSDRPRVDMQRRCTKALEKSPLPGDSSPGPADPGHVPLWTIKCRFGAAAPTRTSLFERHSWPPNPEPRRSMGLNNPSTQH